MRRVRSVRSVPKGWCTAVTNASNITGENGGLRTLVHGLRRLWQRDHFADRGLPRQQRANPIEAAVRRSAVFEQLEEAREATVVPVRFTLANNLERFSYSCQDATE